MYLGKKSNRKKIHLEIRYSDRGLLEKSFLPWYEFGPKATPKCFLGNKSLLFFEKCYSEKFSLGKSQSEKNYFWKKCFAPMLLRKFPLGTSHSFSLKNAIPKKFLWKKVTPKKLRLKNKMLRKRKILLRMSFS